MQGQGKSATCNFWNESVGWAERLISTNIDSDLTRMNKLKFPMAAINRLRHQCQKNERCDVKVHVLQAHRRDAVSGPQASRVDAGPPQPHQAQAQTTQGHVPGPKRPHGHGHGAPGAVGSHPPSAGRGSRHPQTTGQFIAPSASPRIKWYLFPSGQSQK